MGIRYSATIDAAGNVAAGDVYAEFLALATSGSVVHAIRIETKDGLGAQIALSRAYAIGTGAPSGIATGIAHRAVVPTMPLGAAPSRLQAAWSQAPTGYVSRMRDEVLPAATGTLRELWRSDVDGPLVVEPNSSILILNQGSGISAAALKIAVTWEAGDASAR